ncbi:MAG: Hsp70 family protein [Deltaproteobacteria bacterium]|nr:Hsp70 family protein [Deltaproteobacteria bacterium]
MGIVGIDFGTSTTLVAVWKQGKPQLLRDSDGLELTPSVVAYLPGDRVQVGARAALRRGIDPENTLYSVKRIAGRRWFDQEVVDFRESTPMKLERGGDGVPRFITRKGQLLPVDVIAHQLSVVRHYAGFPAGELKNAVLCVPPSYGPEQVLSLCNAARKAGFNRVGTIDEPYAAVVPYLERLSGERNVAVYDLGGGTFDLAVLRVRGLSHRVIASGGDPYLGGDDVDHALANLIANRVLQEHRWDLRGERSIFARLLVAAEKAKLALSLQPSVTVRLDIIDPTLAGKTLEIGREAFDRAIHELVQRSFALCDEVLLEAGLPVQAIDDVILAGGSTYLPAVRAAVESYFGKRPLYDLAPDRTVAQGACISAALQAGEMHGGARVVPA